MSMLGKIYLVRECPYAALSQCYTNRAHAYTNPLRSA